MTTVQVVKTSVTVNNSPIQDYVHPNDQTQPTFEMFLLVNEIKMIKMLLNIVLLQIHKGI